MSMEEFDSKAFENKPVETEVFENRAFEMDSLDNMKDDIIFETDTQDFDTAQNEHQKMTISEAGNSVLVAIDCENTSNNVVKAVSNIPRVDILLILGSNHTLEHYMSIGVIKDDSTLQRNIYTATTTITVKNAADVLLGFELGRMIASGQYRIAMILSSDRIFDVIHDRMIDDKVNMNVLKWNQAGGQAKLVTLLHKLKDVSDDGIGLQYFAINSQEVFQDYFYMDSLVKLGVMEIIMLHDTIGFKVNKDIVKAMLNALSTSAKNK